ncbi:MAG: AIM24 family protein [Myxococcota bacterium]
MSILDALVTLEKDELRQYCHSISIEGIIAQTVQIGLNQGQSLWCSKGSLLAYDPSIDWTLRIPGGASKAVGRMMSGEGITLTHVTARADGANLTLAANQPGRLATWDLDRGPIVCTAGSFVAALGDVDIDVTVARSTGAALFGGAGLFLQKLSGTGIAIVHGAGDFIERQLAPGETLLVSTGNLALFSGEVGYGIRGVGGCGKAIFGGEGIFMTELTGPGWVMMQSLKKLPAANQG